jgi:methionine synthase II (cobalamin-independent)
MFKATRDLTLPATITGSLPRPSWYTENLGPRPFRDALGDARYREQYTDAVSTHIRDQERAGLDIVTDGDAVLDVDVLTFECATTDGMDLEAIGKTITDKKIAVGVVDHRNLQVERPEQVAALIRKALRHIPAERLIVSSDCGFGREGMSRRIAFYKMVSVVRGANIVRRELGLPEAECRAADPRFALADEA